MDLFKDIWSSLTTTKDHVFDEQSDLADKTYNSFVINKGMSQFHDTVLLANEMNQRHNLPNKLQYDFYFYLLPKSKKYTKWTKANHDNYVKYIKVYFNCSFKKAKEYNNLLSQKEKEIIKKRVEKYEPENKYI